MLLADHVMFGAPEHLEEVNPQYACFVTLGAPATGTSTLRVGQLAGGVPYRNPALPPVDDRRLSGNHRAAATGRSVHTPL